MFTRASTPTRASSVVFSGSIMSPLQLDYPRVFARARTDGHSTKVIANISLSTRAGRGIGHKSRIVLGLLVEAPLEPCIGLSVDWDADDSGVRDSAVAGSNYVCSVNGEQPVSAISEYAND